MKLLPLLLALSLAATVLAVSPAEAKPYCTFREADCDGAVCLYGDPDTCFLPRPEDIPIPCKDVFCEIG